MRWIDKAEMDFLENWRKERHRELGKTFYLTLREDWFHRGDVLDCGGTDVVVTRVYRNTWWRRFLRWLGFSIPHYGVKVKIK